MFELASGAVLRGWRDAAVRCLLGVVGVSGMSMVTWAGDAPQDRVVLAIHGGAASRAAGVSPEADDALRAALTEALKAGFAKLQAGGNSLDAVEAAVVVMEDSPLLNAGRGAVFTKEGRNELDASIMSGDTLDAGAVAAVTIVKNPIRAARKVLTDSPHVLLMGRGAEVFATQQNLEIVDPAYFWTERRWNDIQRVWEQDKATSDQRTSQRLLELPDAEAQVYGTVGAVAVDARGNLAAATSTGGTLGKAFGRIGDSPIIGAGNYADNRSAAVSCTGHGEFFIRLAVAHDIAARMRYGGQTVQAATTATIGKLTEMGGRGAAIALDPQGRFVSSYNSPGLSRGWITADGRIVVRLYNEGQPADGKAAEGDGRAKAN